LFYLVATGFLVLKEDPDAKPMEASVEEVAFLEIDPLNVAGH